MGDVPLRISPGNYNNLITGPRWTQCLSLVMWSGPARRRLRALSWIIRRGDSLVFRLEMRLRDFGMSYRVHVIPELR